MNNGNIVRILTANSNIDSFLSKGKKTEECKLVSKRCTLFVQQIGDWIRKALDEQAKTFPAAADVTLDLSLCLEQCQPNRIMGIEMTDPQLYEKLKQIAAGKTPIYDINVMDSIHSIYGVIRNPDRPSSNFQAATQSGKTIAELLHLFLAGPLLYLTHNLRVAPILSETVLNGAHDKMLAKDFKPLQFLIGTLVLKYKTGEHVKEIGVGSFLNSIAGILTNNENPENLMVRATVNNVNYFRGMMQNAEDAGLIPYIIVDESDEGSGRDGVKDRMYGHEMRQAIVADRVANRKVLKPKCIFGLFTATSYEHVMFRIVLATRGPSYVGTNAIEGIEYHRIDNDPPVTHSVESIEEKLHIQTYPAYALYHPKGFVMYTYRCKNWDYAKTMLNQNELKHTREYERALEIYRQQVIAAVDGLLWKKKKRDRMAIYLKMFASNEQADMLGTILSDHFAKHNRRAVTIIRFFEETGNVVIGNGADTHIDIVEITEQAHMDDHDVIILPTGMSRRQNRYPYCEYAIDATIGEKSNHNAIQQGTAGRMSGFKVSGTQLFVKTSVMRKVISAVTIGKAAKGTRISPRVKRQGHLFAGNKVTNVDIFDGYIPHDPITKQPYENDIIYNPRKTPAEKHLGAFFDDLNAILADHKARGLPTKNASAEGADFDNSLDFINCMIRWDIWSFLEENPQVVSGTGRRMRPLKHAPLLHMVHDNLQYDSWMAYIGALNHADDRREFTTKQIAEKALNGVRHWNNIADGLRTKYPKYISDTSNDVRHHNLFLSRKIGRNTRGHGMDLNRKGHDRDFVGDEAIAARLSNMQFWFDFTVKICPNGKSRPDEKTRISRVTFPLRCQLTDEDIQNLDDPSQLSTQFVPHKRSMYHL